MMESFKGYLLLLKRVTEGLAILYLLAPNLFVGIEEKTLMLMCTYIIFVRIVMIDAKSIKEYKLRLACNMMNRSNIFYIYSSSIIKFLSILLMTILNCYILRHIIWVVLDILTK